jgi:hypothetical protein
VDDSIKIYIRLSEKVNQFCIMVVDRDMPLFADVVTTPFLQSTIQQLKLEFGSLGRNIEVYKA